MKRALRVLICCFVSFIAVYLSGYGNLMNDISESLVVTTFLGAVFVLSIVFILIWEMYLGFRNKISNLTKRIEELEQNK